MACPPSRTSRGSERCIWVRSAASGEEVAVLDEDGYGELVETDARVGSSFFLFSLTLRYKKAFQTYIAIASTMGQKEKR